MVLDPILQQLAENAKAAGAPTHELSPVDARAGYYLFSTILGPGPEIGDIEDIILDSGLKLRVYQPKTMPALGVAVFYHGGGWTIGSIETHDRECRLICDQSQCVIISVDYRLGPEHPFPAAWEDAYRAAKWAAAHRSEWTHSTSGIAVIGDSAGGNLAAAVSLMARDDLELDISLQLLIYPCLDLREDQSYPSMVEHAMGPFLLKASIDYFIGHYLSDRQQAAEDARISPILAESVAGLPKTYLATAEFDPLRDQGYAYYQRLKQAGVEVSYEQYDGMSHVFFQMSPILPAAQKLIAKLSDELRTQLSR